MAERGAQPQVSSGARRLLRAARALTTPLVPDDYLELINPLWSTRELRGRVERVEPETETAATVVIKPGHAWPGHKPGQYLRIGVDIDGKRHWRAYSLTSDPDRRDGCISITPKLVPEGQVSPFFVRRIQPGTIVYLGEVEGTFILPDPPPERALFITAGSGITPVMSMLRHLAQRDGIVDAVHIHSARMHDDVIFAKELRELPKHHSGFELHEQITSERGRVAPGHLDQLCPDWREREAFVCGPGEMIDAMVDHWDRAGLCDQLHVERFQPIIGEAGEKGEGGTICFAKSGTEVEGDGSKPILEAGEEAGLDLQYGCRIGICHTCVGKLKSGRLRDLRSGEVFGQEGEIVRICISAPEGPVELEL